jgi:hypothetical protein
MRRQLEWIRFGLFWPSAHFRSLIFFVLLIVFCLSVPALSVASDRGKRALSSEHVEHAPTVQHARDPVYTNSFLVQLHKRHDPQLTNKLAKKLARQHGFVNLGTVSLHHHHHLGLKLFANISLLAS